MFFGSKNEIFYLITPVILLNYVCVAKKNYFLLFNDAHSTFFLRLYCVGHKVKDHSDNKPKIQNKTKQKTKTKTPTTPPPPQKQKQKQNKK